ncbi:hypothetical protein SCUCBS95973_000377 [Sporothrix curviconia]|uniref:Survival motor neuron Tudor domain-containing protein n=1 Tax=Sporothrix curviconia TaxID=1260050 RepID=A0ABP0APT7_9PEZI
MVGAKSTQSGSLWEDTAITKSWDRVVSDYKTFHDVQARGGTVDDLPASLKNTRTGPETSPDAKPETNHRSAHEEAGGGVMAVDDKGATAAVIGGDGSGSNTMANTTAASAAASHVAAQAYAPATGTNGQAFSAATSNTAPLPVPGLLSPQTVLGGADEGLKKLLMSWYYAGYYTGLYEGQQQAAATPSQQQHPGHEQAQATEATNGVDMDIEDGQEIQQ